MLPLSDTIFLGGVRTTGLVDNVTISVEGKERGLEKLEDVANTEIFSVVDY